MSINIRHTKRLGVRPSRGRKVNENLVHFKLMRYIKALTFSFLINTT